MFLQKWLRPGGLLFYTDIISGSGQPSGSLLDYLETLKPCSPSTIETYTQAMQSSGFKNISSDNCGLQWEKICEDDLKIFASTSGESLGDEMNHANMRDLWLKKMEWINAKELSWAVFKANK
ncbi:hypothetical protein SK128_016844 [Halocaridina rubra]|uniref:Uncharacterized protein n=1 Tax=Halocaridina rubra TaxID=373956 RepID=A0AAN8X9Y3_HALRR